MSKNHDNMTKERWAQIKAISWRPYRPSAYRRPFAEITKTIWAGHAVPCLPTENAKRKERRKLGISARFQRWLYKAQIAKTQNAEGCSTQPPLHQKN